MTLYERFLRQAKVQIALQNLTQAEVGRAIGLSRNAISKVMNSKVTLKGDKLLELARFLKIDPGLIILSPKTVTWSGVDMEELKKTCEKVGTVNVKSSINGEWTSMLVDEFLRMLADKTTMEARDEQDQSNH